MNTQEQKLWLLLDSCLRKLKQGRFWTTSLDSHQKNIDKAIKELEEALEMLEND